MISAGLKNKRGCWALWCSGLPTNALYAFNCDLTGSVWVITSHRLSVHTHSCGIPSIKCQCRQPSRALLSMDHTGRDEDGWRHCVIPGRMLCHRSQPEPMEPALALCSHIKHNIIVVKTRVDVALRDVVWWCWVNSWTRWPQRCFPAIKILSFPIMTSTAVKEATWSLRFVFPCPAITMELCRRVKKLSHITSSACPESHW